MKKIFRTIGIVFLSNIGMLILYIGLYRFSYEFHEVDQDTLGNAMRIFFLISTYLAVRFFNKKVNGLTEKNYGFHFRHFTKNIIIGAFIAIAIFGILFLIANAFFGVQIEFSGLKSGFGKPLIFLISHLAVVAIWEEFYFRGFVFNTILKNNFSFYTSALFSALIFSMFHFRAFDLSQTSWLWFIGIVFLGYLLVYIYTFTNSIWSVVVFHIFWNFIVELMDGKVNKIGLFSIKDYIVHEKLIDNLAVVSLGVLLAIILSLARKKFISNKIKYYVTQVITGSNK